MLEIKGEEVVLNKNKGVMGAFVYEKVFNRSLTDDVIKTIGTGELSEVKFDVVTVARLMYLMGGLDKKMSFESFLQEIPEDYDFFSDFEEVLEKAVSYYLPTKSPETKE